MSADAEEEIQQRFREEKCPRNCKKFTCILLGNCNEECKKLDMAQAMICELCADKCETEKQKIILLDMEYYQEKKKLFSKNILDGVHVIKDRHYYLETRYVEVKKKQFETEWYKFGEKTGYQREAKTIKFELELLRKFMDTIEIPYKKELKLEEK